MAKKKQPEKCDNVCVKIRKSFMHETLEFLQSLRKDYEKKQSQVA